VAQTLRLIARIRQQARRFLLVFLIVAGVGCGLVTLIFHRSLAASNGLLIGAALDRPAGLWRTLSVLLLPAATSALLAILVSRFAPGSGGGMGLVLTAYSQDLKLLSLRTWLGTFAANCLSLGSGIPLGPEGPTVVLTCGLSVFMARFLGYSHRVVRGMVPVGAAAGIAAIFNTPIAGVVFALEEILGTASRGILGGALVASVAAAVVHKQALGGQHLLQASPAAWQAPIELVGFAALGLIAGVTSGFVPRVVRSIRRRLARTAYGQDVKTTAVKWALAGLIIGELGLLSPSILGSGYGTISDWLTGKGSMESAALAFLAKGIAVCIALGFSMIGGVFAPSLFLGAALGASLGHLLQVLTPGLNCDPGAYALVGMGAFFAGFMRTPIASVLIVFELTGDYQLVIPLMLAVAIASLIARRISPATMIESYLEEAGVALPEKDSDPLR